jgi:predicted ABC-type ATPase
MSRARDGGYRVTLIFLYLDSPEIAIARVARRVVEGGHSIPSDVIYRRYWAGLRNLLALYLPLAEVASIYDNSLGTGIPIAHKTGHDSLMILDHQRWNRLRERAHEKPDSR